RLALPHLRSLQRCLQDRTQDHVLRLLAFDPSAAASAIPVGDFSFILWIVLGLIDCCPPNVPKPAAPRPTPSIDAGRSCNRPVLRANSKASVAPRPPSFRLSPALPISSLRPALPRGPPGRGQASASPRACRRSRLARARSLCRRRHADRACALRARSRGAKATDRPQRLPNA